MLAMADTDRHCHSDALYQYLSHQCGPPCSSMHVNQSMLHATPVFSLSALSQRQEFQKDFQEERGRGMQNMNALQASGLAKNRQVDSWI